MSVGRWLTLSFGAVVGGIALFVFWFFPARFETQALSLLEDEASVKASVAAHSLRSALVFQDVASVEDVLDGLFQDPMLVRALVLGASDDTIVARSRPSTGPDEVEGRAEIPYSGQALGTVHLIHSTSRVEARVAELRTIVASVSGIIALLGWATVFGISRRVARPLTGVAGTARRIAAGDEQGRASPSSLREVDDLATSFNAMVDQLQSTRTEADDARRRLQIILENLPGVVAVFDTEGTMTFARGREDQEPSPDYFPPDMMQAVQRCLGSGVLAEAECSCEHVTGEDLWFHFAVSPIHRANGEVSGAVAYGTDVSDLRKAQAALEESEEQLQRAQKMEALGRLAGGVAHDFNNALTAIQGHAELAMEDVEVTHPAWESLEVIAGATKHAASVTRRLLAFGRRQLLQPEKVDLRDTIQDLARLVEPMVGENIPVDVRPGTEQAVVEVDPGQLDQALLNLSINARDAMQGKGGTLTLRVEQALYTEADVEERPGLTAGNWQVITVQDTGVGMDAMIQTHLFEPFFSTKGPHQGTGLGLAMVHGFVTQSGGFITVSSQEGEGSEFSIHLPSTHRTPLRWGSESEDGGEAGKTIILLVDDEPAVLDLAARVLRREGFTVLTAPAARPALQVLEANPGTQLVVTDYLMPGRNGAELAADVRRLRPELPVIFMSAHLGDGSPLVGGQELPLIRKPFSRLDLIEGVESALTGRVLS